MIRAVVFDIGGVVLKSKTFHSLTNEYARVMSREEGKVYEAFMKYWNMWKLDKINEREFFENILKDMEADYDRERLREIMYNFVGPDRDIIRLIEKLRKRYKVFSLTNHVREFFAFLDKKHGLEKNFDRIFKSYETRLAKPDAEFFRHMLSEIGLKPEECVFIDDKGENVEAAKKLGIKAILHENTKRTEKELRKLGLDF